MGDAASEQVLENKALAFPTDKILEKVLSHWIITIAHKTKVFFFSKSLRIYRQINLWR